MVHRSSVPDVIGWISVILILIGFAAINFELLTAKQPAYQIINILGALGIVFSSAKKRDYEPVALNAVYGSIAAIALVRLLINT